MVKVESLVQDFLSAQSLKVLPQGPFGDAVNQFVSKDDKHAMELFVSEHLSGQVRQMLGLESDDEDLNSAMEIYRTRIEQQQQESGVRQSVGERQRVLRPKPATWESDFDGPWEEAPDAWTYAPMEAENTSAAAYSLGGRVSHTTTQQLEDDEEEQLVAATKPTKRAMKTTKAAPKKSTASKTATTARGRGRKAAVEPSDEEDVVMDSDEEDAAPAPAPPVKTTRRGAAASKPKAAPKAAATRSSGRTKQTTLNFSQKGATQADSLQISDDEVSDDFEPVPTATTRSRRR